MSEHQERYLGVALALSRMGVHIARTFSERLEPLGLTTSHAAILRVLGHGKHASHQELGRQLGLSAYRISELIGALNSAELVELGRPEHPNDVQLSEKGREVYAKVVKCAIAYETEVLAGLSDDEAHGLQQLLHKLETTSGLEQRESPLPPETLAVTLNL